MKKSDNIDGKPAERERRGRMKLTKEQAIQNHRKMWNFLKPLLEIKAYCQRRQKGLSR